MGKNEAKQTEIKNEKEFLSSLTSKPRGRALDVILVVPSTPPSPEEKECTASSSSFLVSFTHTYSTSSFTNVLHPSSGTNHTTPSTITQIGDKVTNGLTCCYSDNEEEENDTNYVLPGWKVEVYINNMGPIHDLEMRYLGTKKDKRRSDNKTQLKRDEEHEEMCIFVQTQSTSPKPNTLQTLLQTSILTPGKNEISYILHSTSTIIAHAHAHLYNWSSSDTIICSDVDGTITKSDVSGAWNTVLWNKFTSASAHGGVCQLYSQLERYLGKERVVDLHLKEIKAEWNNNSDSHDDDENDTNKGKLRFVYLSSRPIALIEKTKSYITSLAQNDHALPHGPILHHSGSLSQVLYTELWRKDIYEFKADILRKYVVLPFLRAGKPMNEKIFVAGFGNKHTDAIAYEMAGMKRQDIYIINKESTVSCLDNHVDDEEEHHEYGAGSHGICCNLSSGGDGETETTATDETASPSKQKRDVDHSNNVNCCTMPQNDAPMEEIEKEQDQNKDTNDNSNTTTNKVMMEAPQTESMRNNDNGVDIRQRLQRGGSTTATATTSHSNEGEIKSQLNGTTTTTTKGKHNDFKKKSSFEKYIGTTYAGYGDPKLIMDVQGKLMQ